MNTKNRFPAVIKIQLALILGLSSMDSLSYDFEVTTAAEFRAALETAAFNSEDDTIHLADGVYGIGDDTGNAFQYTPFGNFQSLEIYGNSAEDAIISGNGLDQVLVVSGGTLLSVRNVTIRDGIGPSGTFGGGLYAQDTNVTIEGVVFESNESEWGGAVVVNGVRGSLTIEDTRFFDNIAPNACSVGKLGQLSRLTIKNTVFLEESCSSQIIRSNFDQQLAIINTVISGSGAAPEFTAGAIFLQRSNLTMVNSVVANARYGVFNDNNSHLEAWNSAFVGTTFDVFGTFELTVFAFNSFIDPAKINEAPVVTLSNSLSGVDPGFIDAANGDFHLEQSSVLVDAGRSDAPGLLDVDLDGRIRIQGQAVDIGAYEYPYALHDSNADGKADILWRNDSTGLNWLYQMDGATISTSTQVNTVSDQNWKMVGNGDANGDGKADILWRNAASGINWLYLMDGSTVSMSQQINTVSDLDWEIVGNGDYNGDGKADILWRNKVTGQNWMYLMDGAIRLASLGVNTVSNLDWKVLGSADHNGDGKADILWRNVSSGINWLYVMDGAAITSSTQINTVSSPNWKIVGNGDANGDGKADILWRNVSTGLNWLYLMDGSSISNSSQVNTVSDLDWEIVGNGDYNGDGKTDIFWRNKITGQNWMYLMDGATRLSSQAVNLVSDVNWQVVNVK